MKTEPSKKLKNSPRRWGFLRETAELARAAGTDDSGLCRTGLDEYLHVIFPDVDDWVHDKTTGLRREDGKASRYRPDYRSETLRLIVEFDGLPHYTQPKTILEDAVKTRFYEAHGYKVVRIPWFVQLTNRAVQTLFGVRVAEPLFEEDVPSFNVERRISPAFVCGAGLERMRREFARFPEQLETNRRYLASCGVDPILSGAGLI